MKSIIGYVMVALAVASTAKGQDYISAYQNAQIESAAIEKGVARGLMNFQVAQENRVANARQQQAIAQQNAAMQRAAAIRRAEQEQATAEYIAKNSAVRKQKVDARRAVIKSRAAKANNRPVVD